MDWMLRKRERFDGISDLLLFSQGASVFDVGCNRGLIGYEFAKRGAAIIHGCDISPEGIATARHLFNDVPGVASKFEVVDLSKGAEVLAPFSNWYDIVVMLGVYHKLRRSTAEPILDDLMENLAARTRTFFAWSGFPDQLESVDKVMERNGLTCVSRVHLTQLAVIWRRNG